ncbi:MAG: hypothetical protein AB8B48_21445, partial [Pseudomonadales bacterium]
MYSAYFQRASACTRLWLGLALSTFFALYSNSLSANSDITMNMRDADVRTVIQWMSETTGRSFIVDPSVQGNITVLSSQPLSAEQAF